MGEVLLYLAHKKPPPPPRTTIGPWALAYSRVQSFFLLMSEVPPFSHNLGPDLGSDRTLQGYLAHKKPPPPLGPL